MAELWSSWGSSGGQPVVRAEPQLALRTEARLSIASKFAQRGDTARALAPVEGRLAAGPNDPLAPEVGL